MNMQDVERDRLPDQRLSAETPAPQGRALRSAVLFCIRYLLPVAALAVGAGITLLLMNTGPQARPVPPKTTGVGVRTTTIAYDAYPTMLHAMGVVKAARSIELNPQVSGKVTALSEHFVPGGRIVEGDMLLQLDPADYLLAMTQQEYAVVQARNNLILEEGNQLVVKREFELLGEEVSAAEKRLMLREPQLSTLQTELTIAQSKLEQAQLNLARTTVRAPFNGVVQAKSVDIGTWVSTATPLATLVGSDNYWVEVSVPEEQLQWISLPSGLEKTGSLVKVYNPTAWNDVLYREGRVIQLLPGLETKGRMARLLIEVKDPLALLSENTGKPQVLIDSFVRVVIEGRPIDMAVKLPREYLHDGNRLWVFSSSGELGIREVEIGFRNRESVLITEGISDGEEVITTNISTPVEGMVLSRLGSHTSGQGQTGGKGVANEQRARPEGEQTDAK